MTDREQKQAAKLFAEHWKNKGYEKGESQPFWISLLRDVLGVEYPEQYISFEDKVFLGHTSFIDCYIEDTKVLIEQKGINKDLDTPIRQSDGSVLTPFQQAKRYITELPLSKHPRWVVTCNFKEFHIYDMEKPAGEPAVILLENLPTEYYRLQFLVNKGNDNLKKEIEVSLQAGELVGELYDEILKQYNNPDDEYVLKSLNMLCVRLVFCLYAEDAGIFGKHNMFYDYLSGVAARDIDGVREALVSLFKILDTREEERDPYNKEELLAFPYVNGGLFKDENIIIPRFNEKIVDILLNKVSADFDWSEISPTIFGAVFESTLNPDTRRQGGMHYTSIENIHKVIDNLFLDDLISEFESIKNIGTMKTRKERLQEFQIKLASLKFLDPAAGSGNFLTETYISLRRLENKVITELISCDKDSVTGQILLGAAINPIRVSISQFHGIEVNDFAVTVAKTALWIAESQMMKETEDIIHMPLDFLPLKTNACIIEDNALRIEWESVVPKHELSYIMGNPPFIGFTYMSERQKEDMQIIFPGIKNLDFVAAWYKKASDYIQNTRIECGFVSTNSITQGETVARLWRQLSIKINFAYKTFVWGSEASHKAQVHCVIIGFANFDRSEKKLYSDNSNYKLCKNINAYLYAAPNILVESRNKPLCNVSKMVYGNKPADGGNLIIEDEDYADFISHEPDAVKYIRPLLGAVEYLYNKKRWCLWLKGVEPASLRKMPLVLERIRKCKETRENSKAEGIRKFASTPSLFAQITQPEGKNYILIPRVSSEKRRYIPMGFIEGNTIVTDAVQIVPDATLYEFGVLMSNVHMSWMRSVCGRLKSDYRYSKDVVYNNFPWKTPTKEQREKIEKTAKGILEARELYSNSCPADLYDEITMPPELRKAHQLNDKAVMELYGFTKNTEAYKSEVACVGELFKMYQQIQGEA